MQRCIYNDLFRIPHASHEKEPRAIFDEVGDYLSRMLSPDGIIPLRYAIVDASGSEIVVEATVMNPTYCKYV